MENKFLKDNQSSHFQNRILGHRQRFSEGKKVNFKCIMLSHKHSFHIKMTRKKGLSLLSLPSMEYARDVLISQPSLKYCYYASKPFWCVMNSNFWNPVIVYSVKEG
jgi:hypothetical protein